MSKLIYEGPFKVHIQNLVELKQAIGYKFKTEAGILKRFDKFTMEKYPQIKELKKEIVIDWCSKKTYEAHANQCTRSSVIRQLGKYIDSIGYDSYMIMSCYTRKDYVPK